MVLHVLPRGDADGAIAQIGQSIKRQVLLRREHSAWYAHAHHGRKLLCTRLSKVAVVLLVNAVKLEHSRRWSREHTFGVLQLLGNRTAKVPGSNLGLLRSRWCLVHLNTRVSQKDRKG